MKNMRFCSPKSQARWIGASILLALLLALLPAATSAQQFSGLTGVVTDISGASVPGMDVKLVNTLTGATYTTKTDEDGVYRFVKIPPA